MATTASPSPAVRTIAVEPPVEVTRLFDGVPILGPIPEHPWESRVVLNPAAVLVEEGKELDRLCQAWGLEVSECEELEAARGACVLLYRAQGEIDPAKSMAPSHLGLAVLTPGLKLVRRWDEPVLHPKAPFHNLGIEDPRCTRIGDTYYLYYTGYTDPTPHDEYDRRVHICVATTQNFIDWELHGPIEGDLNDVHNKNAALFPEPVDGQYALLHRPMEGPDAMAVHWATSDSPLGPWTSQGLLMEAYTYREFVKSWIGAGGPPLWLGEENEFLAIYHMGNYTPEGSREYDLAAALLDFDREDPVRARIEPLMRPSGAAEQEGDEDLGVDNVLFTCANYQWRDKIIMPYAGADSRIFGASLPLAPLVRALEDLAEEADGDEAPVATAEEVEA